MDRRRYLIENLSAYASLVELHASPFFKECGTEIKSIISTPLVVNRDDAVPRLSSFLRVAQWNIEKGKRLAMLTDRLSCDPNLQWADLILLNEVDCGMVRSGNYHVGRALAEKLRMNLVFAPAHLELTKGTDDELDLPGENRESLQGNAILTRYPVLEARVVALPVCFEPYEFHEKRYGWRNCVWVRLEVGNAGLWAGAVHLEVRNTPSCRAGQLKAIYDQLPGTAGQPHLLGGDLNTSGFARGRRRDAPQSVWRLISRACADVQQDLSHPEWKSEPLFPLSRQAGWFWEGLNSEGPTACAPIGNLEEAAKIPAFLVRMVEKQLRPFDGHLDLKLDWFLGKGIQALQRGEIRDENSGVSAVNPGQVNVPQKGPNRVSDHAPIYADIRLP